MTAEAHREIEQKFDVSDEMATPSLTQLPGVASVSAPADRVLEAEYFDTADLDLATAGVTLRRRTGGPDAGWHMLLPVADHERLELRLPLGEREDEVPAHLLERARAEGADAPLAPVARIRTHRSVRSLLDELDRVLAEFCDDRVDAERLLPPTSRSRWREWEVELVDGPGSLLLAAAMLLRRAGATPTVGSKLGRALGLTAADAGSTASSSSPGTAGEVLLRYLQQQLEQLRDQGPRVAAGEPDSVHRMRVAARRARSALATYGVLLEPGAGDELRAELRWLGSRLGEARDAEVLRARLAAMLQEQPPTTEREELSGRIDRELEARAARGLAGTTELLGSDRYRQLLDTLGHRVAAPPFTERASRPAREEVARLVGRDWARLMRRARAASASGPVERDHALHDVRKAAKRLRYAAESADLVLGARARTLAASGTVIQDALGEHHDSTVSRALLRQLAADGGSAPHPVLEVLHAREEERARAVEGAYEKAIVVLGRRHRLRWLRGGAEP